MIARTIVSHVLPFVGALMWLDACGTVTPPPPAQANETGVAQLTESTNAARQATAPSSKQAGEAHRLVIGVASCWLGGVWSDAMGVDDEVRARDSQQRCHTVITKVYGVDDSARYERLRAVERGEVEELTTKVNSLAKGDPQDSGKRDQLVRFLALIADAERETLYARRASDKVNKDDTGERTPSKRTGDEVDAVAYLQAGSAFRALLQADVGELAPEARAIALLSAMDRMETARGLPKHLKVYAVQAPFSVLFGVKSPTVTDPLQPGTWLAYLTDVARAAGHPVPEKAKTPKDRDLMAWGGTAMGLADKLRDEADRISDVTDLRRMANAVVKRIDIEFRASQAAIRNEP